jgi:hypothetical protein
MTVVKALRPSAVSSIIDMGFTLNSMRERRVAVGESRGGIKGIERIRVG